MEHFTVITLWASSYGLNAAELIHLVLVMIWYTSVVIKNEKPPCKTHMYYVVLSVQS